MKTGWQTKTLGEICDIERGGSPRPIQNFITTASNGINWIKIGDATASGKYIYETEQKIKPEGAKRSRMVYEGDFILSNSMSFGRPYIMKTTGCIHDGWLVLHQPKVDPDFLYHALSSDLVFDQFDRLASGSTVRNLNIGLAKSVQIPYPPLPEQHRIVGILDEAFEGLATAKANAAKNLQNARALFESHLQSVFSQRGEGWVDRTLDQVCIVERGSSPRPIKEYFTTEPDGVNWIKIGDTEEGGKYVHTTAQKITPEGATRSRFVKEGDFILTNSMSYGRPYIMKTSGYIHDGWFVLRLNIAIDTDYFYYLLSSPVVQLQFASLASGSVVKNISGDLVKKAVLPIPPLEHQHIIVEKLMALEEETQRLAAIYQSKLAALEALKKSLLHQAFSGEL
jgi:type I restriction enzyme S subunit